MAEERIYITEIKEGDKCPFEEYCEGFSKLCKGCNILPTRQEIINCMANAISDAAKRSCNKEFVAEAALNALLEADNGGH